MNSTSGKIAKRHFVVLSALLALAAAMVVPLRAQSDGANLSVEDFVVNGFQANNSAPFQVKGNPIGNAVWQRTAGPFLSGTLTGSGANSSQERGKLGFSVLSVRDGLKRRVPHPTVLTWSLCNHRACRS